MELRISMATMSNQWDLRWQMTTKKAKDKAVKRMKTGKAYSQPSKNCNDIYVTVQK